MDLDRRTEVAQWLLEKQLGWIGAADTKAAFIVTLNLGMLAGIAAFYPEKGATPWQQFASWLAVIFNIAAVVFCGTAVRPMLDGPEKSLIFFGKVASLGRSEFNEQIRKVGGDDFLRDLLDQVHRNAEIATAKHGSVRNAVITSFVAAAAWALAIASFL